MLVLVPLSHKSKTQCVLIRKVTRNLAAWVEDGVGRKTWLGTRCAVMCGGNASVHTLVARLADTIITAPNLTLTESDARSATNWLKFFLVCFL